MWRRTRELELRVAELEKQVATDDRKLGMIELETRVTLTKIQDWGDDAGAHLIRGVLSRIHGLTSAP